MYYTHVVGRILRRHNVKYHIYADDIQVYLTPDSSIPGDVQCTPFKLSRCVADIQHWMVENKLKLNQDKTDFFFVAASHHNLKKFGNISLFLPSKSIRNLGVVFDNQMCMSDHVTQLCKSINWLIKNINRIRPYIDVDTCHNLVRALVLISRLDYCNSYWMVSLRKILNVCRSCKISASDWFVSNPNLSMCHLCLINCIGCQSVKELCTRICCMCTNPWKDSLPSTFKTT